MDDREEHETGAEDKDQEPQPKGRMERHPGFSPSSFLPASPEAETTRGRLGHTI